MSEEQKKQKILEFIKRHNICVVATIDPSGKPEAAVIEFGQKDNLELIFDTFTTYRKYQNLKNNPKVAFVIGWDQEITVQYEGEAVELTGQEIEEYKNIYLAKLPEAVKFTAMEGIRYFKVIPKWIRYADYSKDPWEIFEVYL